MTSPLDLALQLQTLIGERAIYPIVAVVLTLLVQLIRKSPKTAAWWQRVPEGWRWVMPVAAGATLGFIQGYQADLPLLGALLNAGVEALAGIFGVSLTSMGLAAALKESRLPWDGGAGGKPAAPGS